MPLLRTLTGCRCRKTLVSMTTTRLRRSRGAGWRKMLFQTWLLRMKSRTDIGGGSHLDEGLGVGPLAALLLELARLVDDDLAIVPDSQRPGFQRARGRPLEVDAADVEAAAVAGALELLSAFEPVGGAAEVGAGGTEGVDLALVAHDPHVLVLELLDHLAFL